MTDDTFARAVIGADQSVNRAARAAYREGERARFRRMRRDVIRRKREWLES